MSRAFRASYRTDFLLRLGLRLRLRRLRLLLLLLQILLLLLWCGHEHMRPVLWFGYRLLLLLLQILLLSGQNDVRQLLGWLKARDGRLLSHVVAGSLSHADTVTVERVGEDFP